MSPGDVQKEKEDKYQRLHHHISQPWQAVGGDRSPGWLLLNKASASLLPHECPIQKEFPLQEQ